MSKVTPSSSFLSSLYSRQKFSIICVIKALNAFLDGGLALQHQSFGRCDLQATAQRKSYRCRGVARLKKSQSEWQEIKGGVSKPCASEFRMHIIQV
jgi:hypothetical protein